VFIKINFLFKGDSLSGRTSFVVTLSDENDEIPVFDNVVGSIEVNENMAVVN
jgi:hypothetical protein